MAAAADAAAAPAAAAAATADPIRKFNYICATDTSCYAVAAAAFGFSKPARAALRSDVVVDQQRSNKLYTRSLLCCCSQWRCAALHVPACLPMCVCIGACQHNYVRNVHTHTHTGTHRGTHGDRPQKAFALKVFLGEFRAPFFFSNMHTHARGPLSHTHTHSSSSDAAHQKLHRQRGDKTKMKKKNENTSENKN